MHHNSFAYFNELNAKRTWKRENRSQPFKNNKIQRIFKLIAYLNDFRAIKEIAEHLKIHEKTAHRYINILIQLGFEVHYKNRSPYFQYKITNLKEFFGVIAS